MVGRGAGLILGHMEALLGVGTFGGLSDRELLELFLAHRDEVAELAFAVLVERHGPMVLGVCRRLLGDPHEAEDAFQATFLVLVRRARSIRVEGSLGRWLFGVATRVAAHARADARRRRLRERSGVRPARRARPRLGPCRRRTGRGARADRAGDRRAARAVSGRGAALRPRGDEPRGGSAAGSAGRSARSRAGCRGPGRACATGSPAEASLRRTCRSCWPSCRPHPRRHSSSPRAVRRSRSSRAGFVRPASSRRRSPP